MTMETWLPAECDVCGALMGHDPFCSERARSDRRRALRLLEEIKELHRPLDVPAIPGTSMEAFTRCSCTPGLLFAECPTAVAARKWRA